MKNHINNLRKNWKINRKQYEDFIEIYNKKHLRCPRCYELNNYKMKNVSSIFDYEDSEGFKDNNICICNKCGDIHTVHERIS